MRLLLIHLLSACLLYVGSISIIPTNAYAGPIVNDLSEESKKELVQNCMDDYELSKEECTKQVEENFQETIEEAEKYNKQADAISEGHVFESFNIIVSAASSSLASVLGLFDVDNWKFPSCYLGAISGLVVLIWYILALKNFHNVVNQKKDDLKKLIVEKSKEIGDSEIAILVQEEELNLLKDMKPEVENMYKCFETGYVYLGRCIRCGFT